MGCARSVDNCLRVAQMKRAGTSPGFTPILGSDGKLHVAYCEAEPVRVRDGDGLCVVTPTPRMFLARKSTAAGPSHCWAGLLLLRFAPDAPIEYACQHIPGEYLRVAMGKDYVVVRVCGPEDYVTFDAAGAGVWEMRACLPGRTGSSPPPPRWPVLHHAEVLRSRVPYPCDIYAVVSMVNPVLYCLVPRRARE